MNNKQKIGFKDLDTWVKIPLTVGYIILIVWVIAFLIGIISVFITIE